MLSFDVVSMLPIGEALEVIAQRLQEDQTLSERTALEVDDICKLQKCDSEPPTSNTKTAFTSRLKVRPWALHGHQL